MKFTLSLKIPCLKERHKTAIKGQIADIKGDIVTIKADVKEINKNIAHI